MPSQYFPLVVVRPKRPASSSAASAPCSMVWVRPPYDQAVGRSILVGPINTWNIIEKEAGGPAQGNRLRTLYSALPGFEWNEAPAGVAAGALQEIEQRIERPLPLRRARLWPL